jgi:formate hydrogenlyase subunit 6/NADH:ubiquinone oxidoreductase subunit I
MNRLPTLSQAAFAQKWGGKMARNQILQMLKRTTSSLFTKPATTEYPFVKPQFPRNLRGQPLLDTTVCRGCGLCSRDCPAHAIEMVEVGGGLYPQFRLDRCIFCNQCVETCHNHAIRPSDIFELATTDKTELIVKPKPLIIC